MGLEPDWSRVIGQHREYPVELVTDGPHNAVHPFYRLHLLLNTPEMACFVRCLDVDIDKVQVLDRIERGVALVRSCQNALREAEQTVEQLIERNGRQDVTSLSALAR